MLESPDQAQNLRGFLWSGLREKGKVVECIWICRLLKSQRTDVCMKPVSVTCSVENSVLVVCSVFGEKSIVLFSPPLEIVMKTEKSYGMWENFIIVSLRIFFQDFSRKTSVRTFWNCRIFSSGKKKMLEMCLFVIMYYFYSISAVPTGYP